MSGSPATLVWFRFDLRVSDHPALREAIAMKQPVIPLFTWSPQEHGDWPAGAASRWWLHRSLMQLQQQLHKRGSRLILRQGNSLEQLRQLVRAANVTHVLWHRSDEPTLIARDALVRDALTADGLRVRVLPGTTLFEPGQVLTQAGDAPKVFTPFWRTCLKQTEMISQSLAAPKTLPAPIHWPESASLDELAITPTHPWTKKLDSIWEPGEQSAQRRLSEFINQGLATYHTDRDRPDISGTSRFSAHLHFGEMSTRQVWHAVQEAKRNAPDGNFTAGADKFLAEIGWREFSYHLLYHFPYTPDKPLQPRFEAFKWEPNDDKLRAWQRGTTGYPIVDAGMRQLWNTGWMHNRVRMIVASFLIKDLMQSWQTGTRWFWDTLVDADLPNNTQGWQWTAGSGADAAPFFRIFNPVSQGKKFDPQGRYIRQYVPELATLSDKFIHEPWTAPTAVLRQANIRLDETYPRPMVDHAEARKRALAAFEHVKR